ncbi:type IV pilus modification PilV family protein [Bdellovibrio sp. HCB337]|uniref:type IV pilus modification PilV family protein n=1 Tax=Bdellovibrio sp. HCB337 TaxID=3394358 RepID=UPI0039A4AB83
MKLRNTQGFTIVEVLVAVGIAAVGLGLVASTQMSMIKDHIRMRKTLEANIDETLAERILFNDFNGLDPAYNNLNVKDDAGLLFFDYYPDIPENSLTARKDRELTLALDGRTEFYIITQDRSAGSLLIYDPVMAYNVGPSPANFNIAADLSFISLNQKNWIGAQRPGFWIPNKTLMLDTPAKIRGVANGKVDLKIPPRSPIFMGSVSGGSLNPVVGVMASMLIKTHPGSGTLINSADDFLRNVPSIGGGQSIVRLRAIKIVRYHIEKSKLVTGFKEPPANLYRTTYENGSFGNPVLLADQIDKFSLRRDSVLKRMIYFKVHKAERL